MDTLFTRKRCDKESTAVVLMCREEPGERTRTQERGTAMKGRGGDQENQAGRKKSVVGEWMDGIERRNEETVMLTIMMCRL
jgi:hypothetical protein